jgi:hypothetical protein
MTAADTESAIDDAFVSVWRQALVEQKKIITVGEATFLCSPNNQKSPGTN